MTDGPPTPPDTLPKYIAEGLPKQDDETLADVREYVESLVEHRDREVTADTLPEAAAPVDPEDPPPEIDPSLIESYRAETGRRGGHFALERVRCGADCTCNDGEGHGPYVYHYYYADGDLQSAYVGKPAPTTGDR